MNIWVLETKSFGLLDVKMILSKSGHNIISFYHDSLNERKCLEFDNYFDDMIQQNYKPDIVFSLNYYPIVSMNCERYGFKYISVVYDNPHIALYHFSLVNKCNTIHIFDYSMYEELLRGGVDTVKYTPLPVYIERYEKMVQVNNDFARNINNDVAFVGAFYNEAHTLYDRLAEKLNSTSEYTKGYLDSVINAQSYIYGYNFLQEMITDEILEEIYRAYPYEEGNDSIATKKYVYADYFLSRKVTEIERKRLLKAIAKRFKLSLYTNSEGNIIENAINYGSIDYYDEMPYVFNKSKININITLKSIRTGIPLRAIDIMASKGFLLTNYQADLFRHFEPNVDFVYFESEQDLLNKIEYYLEHDEERKKIAENGFRKVSQVCNYEEFIKNTIIK